MPCTSISKERRPILRLQIRETMQWEASAARFPELAWSLSGLSPINEELNMILSPNGRGLALREAAKLAMVGQARSNYVGALYSFSGRGALWSGEAARLAFEGGVSGTRQSQCWSKGALGSCQSALRGQSADALRASVRDQDATASPRLSVLTSLPRILGIIEGATATQSMHSCRSRRTITYPQGPAA